MELFTTISAFIVLQVGPMGTLYYRPLHYRMYYFNVTEIFCDLKKAVINKMTFAKMPSPVTLSLICELPHIATCDTSTTGNFCKNL